MLPMVLSKAKIRCVHIHLICQCVVLQFSGVNAVIFNAVEIFSSAGSNINEYVENILLNVTQVSKGLLKYVLEIHNVISQRPVAQSQVLKDV